MKKFLFLFVIPVIVYSLYPHGYAVIDVEYGMPVSELSRRLKSEGVIVSEFIFVRTLSATGIDKRIKAGRYKINKKFGMFDALIKFYRGEITGIKFKVPEGATSEYIAQELEASSITSKTEFINYVKQNKLNGFLLPDTYFLSKNMPAGAVAETIFENFKKNFPEYSSDDFYKKLILASIVEKEASDKLERRIIAGIFYNRLKRGMKLESCATVRYAINKPTAPLTVKDLRFKSAYNTYINHGLPPEPICNPGSDAIKAVLNPLKTDLLYFQVSYKGRHSFFVNFKEHAEFKRMKKKLMKNL